MSSRSACPEYLSARLSPKTEEKKKRKRRLWGGEGGGRRIGRDVNVQRFQNKNIKDRFMKS